MNGFMCHKPGEVIVLTGKKGKTHMKTKIILSGLLLTLASAGLGSSAMASANKYADYRATVEATKGTSATPAPKSAQYSNKYERDLAQKSGLGGSVFSSIEGPHMGDYNFKMSNY